MSLPEVLIWTRIRRHGFRRQHPLGPFILDFYRPSDRLCIEIDGQQHDLKKDQARDEYLRSQEIRTVRIPAYEVLRDPDAAAEFILSLRRSSPACEGGGPRTGGGGE